MPSALAAHYQSLAERWKALKAAGAIGVLGIPNPAAMDIPWTRMSLNRTQPSMALVGADFDETAGDLFAATFNPEYGELLFAGTGHSFAEIADLGKDRKPLPRFALPLSLRARTRLATKDVHSNNVVAVIPGSDPVLKREYVVLTAHIDHLGIGEPINGDRINNGAMDNASGSAMLLDLARSLKRGHDKLKRSVLLVWVTGEEKGLLGSRYYATRPTVPAGKMVADLNTDMFLPIVPLKVLTVYGLAESDLGDRVTAVAAHLGYRVQADPEPLRNRIIRSDQYNFIKQGVPSLAMKVGFDPGSEEEKVFKQWLTDRYHAPSDDADQPVNFEAAAGFEEVMRGLTVQIANDPRRPSWKSDSFFRRFAKAAP
jgi:Zn-dependent M28 family amino/carboxypeptidase